VAQAGGQVRILVTGLVASPCAPAPHIRQHRLLGARGGTRIPSAHLPRPDQMLPSIPDL